MHALLIITGRLHVYLQVKTLHFHIQALPRNYISKVSKLLPIADEVALMQTSATSSAIGNTYVHLKHKPLAYIISEQCLYMKMQSFHL